MINKFFDLYEKHFYIIILLLFITITILGIMPLRYINETNIILRKVVEINAKVFHMIKDYKYIIQLIILVISSIYVFSRGNKRNKIIIGLAIGLSILTFINSITIKQFYFIQLEISHIVAFPLFFVFLNTFEIFIKRKGKVFFEELVFKTIKIITIYIALMFLLGKVTDLYCITYSQFPYGYSGRFLQRNAISHVFVMITPLLMYFFYKRKEYRTLFYIIIAIICALLLGTKSAYLGVYISLVLFILLALFNHIKIKKINFKKTILITLVLIFLLIINKNLYAAQFIKQDITNYNEVVAVEKTKEIDKTDKASFILKDRPETGAKIADIFKSQTSYIKMTGLGFYFPKNTTVLIEMDIHDILFKQGILGLLLYLYMAICYITLIIKNIKNNFKKIPIEEVLFLLTIVAMTTIASIFAGHVMYNYIALFFYALIIIFAYSKTKLI